MEFLWKSIETSGAACLFFTGASTGVGPRALCFVPRASKVSLIQLGAHHLDLA